MKSEAAIHDCAIKKLLQRVLKISQKKNYAWASF